MTSTLHSKTLLVRKLQPSKPRRRGNRPASALIAIFHQATGHPKKKDRRPKAGGERLGLFRVKPC